MGAFLSELKESIFPHNFTCDICGRETFDDANLCPSCAKTVTLNDGATCPVCGRKTKSDGLCLECKAHAPAFVAKSPDPARTAGGKRHFPTLTRARSSCARALGIGFVL